MQAFKNKGNLYRKSDIKDGYDDEKDEGVQKAEKGMESDCSADIVNYENNALEEEKK